MMEAEEALIIEDEEYCIYGILRGNSNSKKIVTFIPAPTGTRIGPQRMFVELSNELVRQGLATLCIDIPPCGDSYNKLPNRQKNVAEHYYDYLERIVNYINVKYNFEEIVLASISVGCWPILEFSEKNGLKQVILLSPYFGEINSPINIRNVRAYYQKFFRKETWYKLVTLKLNYKKIFSNIFHKK